MSSIGIPSTDQRLLLRACFSDKTAHWEAWQAGVDIDRLDHDSQWLLPLLFRQLQRLGVHHPVMGRYRSVYLHNWYKHNLLLHQTRSIAALLHEAHLPFMLGRGLGCLAIYYEDVGVRPLSEADVIVPAANIEAALFRLGAHGIDYTVREAGCIFISSASGHTIRMMTPPTSIPPIFWTRMIQASLEGWSIRHLNYEDQVAYMRAGKKNWDSTSSLLWYADMMIVSKKRTPGVFSIDALFD